MHVILHPRCSRSTTQTKHMHYIGWDCNKSPVALLFILCKIIENKVTLCACFVYFNFKEKNLIVI